MALCLSDLFLTALWTSLWLYSRCCLMTMGFEHFPMCLLTSCSISSLAKRPHISFILKLSHLTSAVFEYMYVRYKCFFGYAHKHPSSNLWRDFFFFLSQWFYTESSSFNFEQIQFSVPFFIVLGFCLFFDMISCCCVAQVGLSVQSSSLYLLNAGVRGTSILGQFIFCSFVCFFVDFLSSFICGGGGAGGACATVHR